MKITKILFSILAILLCTMRSAMAQDGGNVAVSGIVTSAADGQPIIGVYVFSSATDGVITDLDGFYTIETKAGVTLTFQCTGFADVTYTVPSGSPSVTFDVEMENDSELLDETVVVAYGVRKKGTITGSVSTVKADAIADTPTAAFDQALQGQVPGLTVISASGEPSASATMQIRGTNSINSGTAPLYILDGVAISAGDFNSISPADIESLTVLRDASSTSIYGARAANGVIVITTKRGRNMDKPNINFKMNLGISNMAVGNWDLMNTAERIQYEKEVGMDAGQNYDVLSKTDVNWLDAVFNDRAMLQSYEMAVSGANDKTNFYFSGGYYDQEGIAMGSDFKRYSMRFNVEHQMAGWLKMGTNTMFNYQGIEQAEQGSVNLVTPISASRFMLPYWNPFRADGSTASIADGSWRGDGQNPVEWLENNPRVYKKYKVMSTVFAEAKPIEGLTLRSQFSIDFGHIAGFMQSFPSYLPNQGEGFASRNSQDNLVLSVTNTANYSFDIDDIHSFNFIVGQEGVDYHYESFDVSTQGQKNDALTDIATGTRATGWGSSGSSDYGLLSFFGRGEYNYDSKYYLELSARADASSRFGTSGRWSGFWSVGLMYNLRNEDFMKSTSNWLTNAQIALSTGTSGNSSIPNYEHLALIGGGADYAGNSGVAPIQPGNPDLGWESTWATNLGFHFGFWNRLNADLELYNKNTYDMLMMVPLSYATSNGYGYRWSNVGSMVNRGVELNLTGTLVEARDFYWQVNTNVSYNYNKISSLYNGVDSYEPAGTNTKMVVGHPVGEYYMNRFAGVNPANGDALWYTKDGEITNVLRDEDKVLMGKTSNAPWVGGFGTSLGWKGLSLSAQFSWVADRWVINNDRYFDESNGRFMSYNQSNRLLERWKEPGDITDIPRHGEYTEFDSKLLEDASFIRLKNLTLGWSMPRNLLDRIGFISGIRFFLQGQNLLTFTKFTGLDPEGVGSIYAAEYPMSRQYTFGLDITF